VKFLTGKGNTFSSFLQLHQLYKIVKSILQLLYSYAGARTQKQEIQNLFSQKTKAKPQANMPDWEDEAVKPSSWEGLVELLL
jgi:hypothetical protein